MSDPLLRMLIAAVLGAAGVIVVVFLARRDRRDFERRRARSSTAKIFFIVADLGFRSHRSVPGWQPGRKKALIIGPEGALFEARGTSPLLIPWSQVDDVTVVAPEQSIWFPQHPGALVSIDVRGVSLRFRPLDTTADRLVLQIKAEREP